MWLVTFIRTVLLEERRWKSVWSRFKRESGKRIIRAHTAPKGESELQRVLFIFIFRQEILSACCFADGNNLEKGGVVIQERKLKMAGTWSLSRVEGMRCRGVGLTWDQRGAATITEGEAQTQAGGQVCLSKSPENAFISSDGKEDY